MTSLYEITAEIKQRIDQVLEEAWLPQTTLDSLLPAMKAEALQKQKSIAAYILNLESDIEQMAEYVDRMKGRIKTAENRVTNLKSLLVSSMQTLKQDKVECGEFTIKLKNNPPKVVINNADLVPIEFMRIVPAAKEPDKNKIADELKKEYTDEQGNKVMGFVAGCNLEQGTRLEIK